jgi:predicted transcriptional regulator
LRESSGIAAIVVASSLAEMGGPGGYTSGMKTAISIPDELFRKADELADRLGKSRSEVYREALADYVSRREPGAVTRALDELADELAADGGEFGAQAARRALERSEW